MQVLILGCGDIGTRVGLSLLDRGWRVAAARRNPDRLPDQFDRHKVNLTHQQTGTSLMLWRRTMLW